MGLRIGTIEVPVPVVLAPMAGITNPAYRQLCREQAEQGAPGIRPAGLFVCEMITSRGIVERIPKTFEMLHFDDADPMKSRKGIDDDHLTYLDAGRIAEQSGVAAIALHGRTVAQAYGGDADWEAIAQLVDAVSIPVLGNGDIWEAADAAQMMAETGCAGVVIGRGCLGRPWLFRDLAALLRSGGSEEPPLLPTLGEVMAMVRRHGELLAESRGERYGLTDLRKHMAWYFKGFGLGGELRHALGMVSSFAELDDLFVRLDPETPFPIGEVGTPRGRQGSPRERVTVPYGWLDSMLLDASVDLSDAESDVSGG